jgi:rhomboid protease GluP
MTTHGSLLCPACHRLISADEQKCPYCGLTAPGEKWRHSVFTSLFSSGDRLINALVITNAVMFVISLLISRRGLHLSANPLTFLSPDSQALIWLGATGTLPIDRLHHWWTLVSASYLHGGVLHIAFNMIALWQIAPMITREYGTYRMFVIYTLSGVGGFLISYLVGVPLTIGASAAVCGFIGAALYYGKSRGGVYGQAIYRQVGGWALSIALFGFIVPGINNWAHGGGMATGILLGVIMGYQERNPENRIHRALGRACLLGTLLVLSWALITTFF